MLSFFGDFKGFGIGVEGTSREMLLRSIPTSGSTIHTNMTEHCKRDLPVQTYPNSGKKLVYGLRFRV